MKKIIIISMLLILSAASFSQPATTTDYLQKSKKQKTAAWIMMSGGLACSLAGSILSAQLDFMGDTAPLFDDKTSKTGIVLKYNRPVFHSRQYSTFYCLSQEQKEGYESFI